MTRRRGGPKKSKKEEKTFLKVRTKLGRTKRHTPFKIEKKKTLKKKNRELRLKKKKLSGTYHKQNSNIVGGNSFEKRQTTKKKINERQVLTG